MINVKVQDMNEFTGTKTVTSIVQPFHVGDFPPIYPDPGTGLRQPQIPIVQPNYPLVGDFNGMHGTSGVFAQLTPRWRMKNNLDEIELSIDQPGVDGDVSVEVMGDVLQVNARRFDTKEFVKHEHSLKNFNVDMISATAVLEHGVLTITMKTVKLPAPHKITVNVK